jgi:3-methyladenine DNA glycosylase AlkD
MNTNLLVGEIRNDLKKSGTPKGKKSFQRFFKEKVKCYGVKSGDVGKISKKYWGKISNQPRDYIFDLCEKLYSLDNAEEAFIASSFCFKKAGQYKPTDFKIFESWIDRYINNWAKCDGFCTGSVAAFLKMYPNHVDELKTWAKSKNIWLKRASAVSLIPLAREGRNLKEAFEIASILLMDPADMVQKGYGWLLKEASRKHENEVFNFVMKHEKNMPRTVLRYAVELMPRNLRILAMKRI